MLQIHIYFHIHAIFITNYFLSVYDYNGNNKNELLNEKLHKIALNQQNGE